MGLQPVEDIGSPEVRARAFTEHVLPEVAGLLRMAHTLTSQPADAEDLVQDTLLSAYRAIDRFDGRHPRAWLRTILRRTELNRRRRRRPQLLNDLDLELPQLTAAGGVESPEEVVIGACIHEAVGAALTTLSHNHQQVVRLVDIGGLTYAEAAHLLEVPEGTVMSRLYRARRRIRVQLAAAGLAPERPRTPTAS
ncbi:RNA polymerase sigma factor [Streptomyces chiangmaiensis]|uniref:RNA polymerase sigma factor n=1 Tax=Streptomyces chiangmaiensis TaxID=766497 RepID=A0ABU7FL50_9ACTN|nr:sigma-70 family RNA polymerase sigma factor [Streptomyces chiangmaiensis]MED7824665.1 sigma-70 family RNA polymerase sigma factor [Streptomyces chiangmaiensis]